jgi:hypothetical protein
VVWIGWGYFSGTINLSSFFAFMPTFLSSKYLHQILFFKMMLRKREILWVFQFGNVSLAVGCLLMPTTSIIYYILGISSAWVPNPNRPNFIVLIQIVLILTLGENTTSRVLMWVVSSLFCCVMAAGFMTCLPVITTIINNCANPER